MSLNRTTFWIIILLAALAVGLLSISIFSLMQREVLSSGDEGFFSNNLAVFGIVNLNIIVVSILMFLAGKNIVKLFLDRRRNIFGSRLRSRLVVAFVGLSLVPSLLLYFVAQGIVGSVLQGWFSPQIEAAVDSALEIAREYEEESRNELLQAARTTQSEIQASLSSANGSGDLTALEMEQILAVLKSQRVNFGLSAAFVYSVDQAVQIREPESAIFPLFPALLVDRESQRIDVVRNEVGEITRFQVVVPLRIPGRTANELLLLVVRDVAPELGANLRRVADSHGDYRELRTYRRPIASSSLLTLGVLTLLIVFGAIWVGFYLAKGLSVPIQLLAAATQQIAQGNLNDRIPEVGDDELAILVRSFNKMTNDLQATTGELVERKRYIETILENVEVGVVSVNFDSQITTFNSAASEMLGVNLSEERGFRTLAEVLPTDVSEKMRGVIRELAVGKRKKSVIELVLGGRSGARHIQCTASRLLDANGAMIGAVLLLDDLTELVSAQRMSAWRDVARRIAHEIKNPLTPIQLSAQRIQRRLGGSDRTELSENERELITEGVTTIISQVEMLRTLVNEFSNFARMPKTQLKRLQLNDVITETTGLYREAHTGVVFVDDLDPELPEFDIDREQMNRLFVNLLDNAVAAVGGVEGRQREISIASRFDEDLAMATVYVTDNGSGIPDWEKGKVFEPHFSTKHSGTGLGLAIVSTIVSDHDGFIRVRDNHPYGTVFVIELPVHAKRRDSRLTSE